MYWDFEYDRKEIIFEKKVKFKLLKESGQNFAHWVHKFGPTKKIIFHMKFENI